MAKYGIDFTVKEEGKFSEMSNADMVKAFEQICEAGTSVISNHMKSKAPRPSFVNQVRVTQPYVTPSDGAINQKVYPGGYLPFRGKRKTFKRRGRKGGVVYTTTAGVPTNFIANLFVYGRRNGAPFPRDSAFLTGINQRAVESAMKEQFEKILQERYK